MAVIEPRYNNIVLLNRLIFCTIATAINPINVEKNVANKIGRKMFDDEATVTLKIISESINNVINNK